MQVKPEQLPNLLRKGLAPVYLLYGDEPLQLTEAADAVRSACREQGCEDRQVHTVMPGFDWNLLAADSDTLSLFGGKRLLDLRVPEGKVGNEGARFLSAYAKSPPADTVLLVTAENPPSAISKAQWFKRLESCGVAVRVWPLSGQALIAWLRNRASEKGLQLAHEALQLLAQRTEGNLLAAAQEIDKIHVLHGPGLIDEAAVRDMVADSARYDVFDLTEAVLAGQVARVDRTLAGLASEGIASAVVLWAITREIRLLLQFSDARKQGVSMIDTARKLRVWDQRRRLVEKALGRLDVKRLHEALLTAARIDRIIKGQMPGSPWDGLRGLCLMLASGNSRSCPSQAIAI
ncbi:MAG: hypothetical protein AXA67_11320 [Methylothermaceae bacteria B42]|nr:MAG: hypothetical protein AXA67_11320 [Methylothermaceae bacteria B42]HHJ39121.1 DNA polymerase III subunit delta [Methylothermaceae bacterium]